MAKKYRKFVFIACILLFIFITPMLVFYSQGYRINFNSSSGEKKITQTGGLFLKALPKQADIFINGKLKKKTDFFFGSVLIENLSPNQYNIEVKKDGYSPWTKSLNVYEKQVTEARNIILIPQNISTQAMGENVINFWLSPDQKNIVSQEKSITGWDLKIYGLDNNVKSHLIEKKKITSLQADILSFKFSSDSKSIVLELGIGETIRYFNLNISTLPPIIKEIKSPISSLKNILAYYKINEDIYYLDSSGFIFKSDSSLKEKIKQIEAPFQVKSEIEYSLYVYQKQFFIKENQDLFVFNTESQSFEKIFDGVNLIKPSIGEKKLAIYSNNEIWIMFLKDKEDYPQKKAGEKLFLLRLSENIKNLSWLNADYLIFSVVDDIKIMETDERDRINISNVVKMKNPDIIWNKTNKKIYILSEEKLYSSDDLLP